MRRGPRGSKPERKRMPVSDIVGFLILGSVIGVISGMLGIGGGILMIPALVFLFSFTHKQAVGTSLGMMLPPIGIFAFLQYYRADEVKLAPALLLGAAFMIGAWLGALLVTSGRVPDRVLRVGFALFIIYVAGNMLFRSERRVWAVVQTLMLVGAFALAQVLFRMIGKRWDRGLAADAEYQRRVRASLAPDYEI
jgi:uncharacterized membrane protein YfcA